MNTDVHTLTGAYVLDALSEMERRAFEDHMSGCPACYQEVAELRETTARLGAATAANPPPQLWHKVLAATAHARQLPPVSSSRHSARPKRRSARIALFAAAASLLAAVGLGVGWYMTNTDLQDQLTQSQTDYTKLKSVLKAPDLFARSAPINGGGTATALVSKSQNEMVMLVQGAPALGPQQVYQAWYLTPQGQATPAGTLAASTGSIPAKDLTPSAGANQLGLTVEPVGGSTTPHLPILATVPLN